MSEKIRRVGVFGGAFDPVHVGHLWLAMEASRVGALDLVLMIPCSHPPHKDECSAPFSHRLAMLELAMAGHPLMSACDVERSLTGRSYSVRTAALLREAWGDDVWMGFILGGDAISELHTWKDAARFVDLCDGLLVAPRPGYETFCHVATAEEKIIE